MNELKYKILKFLDMSNENFTGSEILQHFQHLNYDVNDVEKHFFDLHRLGYTDNGTYEDVTHVTVHGREYIDNYEYRKKHDSLYVDQLNSAKETAKFSKIISVISAVIAALAVASNIITAICLN